MAKRNADTHLLDQTWFIELSPNAKAFWLFLERKVDSAGLWKIDLLEFRRVWGMEINLKEVISEINTDYDKFTGEKEFRERLKIVDERIIWITGFFKFHYGENELNPKIPVIRGALKKLEELNILSLALAKGWLTLAKGYERVNKGLPTSINKDININKDLEAFNTNAVDSETEEITEAENLDEETVEEIYTIWRTTWGRNPNNPEFEVFYRDIYLKFGAKKAKNIMKESALSGFKKIKTLIESLDGDGKIIPRNRGTPKITDVLEGDLKAVKSNFED